LINKDGKIDFSTNNLLFEPKTNEVKIIMIKISNDSKESEKDHIKKKDM